MWNFRNMMICTLRMCHPTRDLFAKSLRCFDKNSSFSGYRFMFCFESFTIKWVKGILNLNFRTYGILVCLGLPELVIKLQTGFISATQQAGEKMIKPINRPDLLRLYGGIPCQRIFGNSCLMVPLNENTQAGKY